MKKLFILIIALLMICPVFTACAKKENEGKPDNTEKTELVIAADGTSDYTVLRSDSGNKETTAAVKGLRDKIKEKTGAMLDISSDLVALGEAKPVIGKTIVIGKVQDESAEAVYKDMGVNDYAVTVKNDAVYIVGGSELGTYYAWLHFKNSFIGEGTSIKVPADYSYYFEGADSRDDYIADPDKLLVNWISEFEVPSWMREWSELTYSISTPNGRMMSSGHRGDFQHYPENSIEGIVSCIQMGCDNVELDLWLTRDGKIVLMHDETLTRTTDFKEKAGKNGLPASDKISDWTLDELRHLRLKMNNGVKTDYLIPTFDEALTVCRNHITIRIDKMTDLASWTKYLWPAMLRCNATQTCILNYHIGINEADTALKSWAVQSPDGTVPYYFGKINDANRGEWNVYNRKLSGYNMIPLVRWSDFNTNSELVGAVNSYKTDLQSIGGKLRIYVDAHQNAAQETEPMWQMLYDNGVNFVLVNHPFELCKFIAANFEDTRPNT